MKPGIEITLVDGTRCVAKHVPSGVELTTDVMPEQGGGGTSFTSTDLVGVALGTCIGSSIAPVALREGVSLVGFRLAVEKTMAEAPRRIERLTVTITLPSGLTERQRTKIRNAAATCTVHRSLHGAIDVEVRFAETE